MSVLVDKQLHSMSLYHPRQCCSLHKPFSDCMASFALWRTTTATSCEDISERGSSNVLAPGKGEEKGKYYPQCQKSFTY